MPEDPRPEYRKQAGRRPWTAHFGESELKDRFIMWLSERGGIVVYENQTLDSSALGDQTFMPIKFLCNEKSGLQWAPLEHRPNGGLPSQRQQQVDLIELSDFQDATPAAVVGKCFKFEESKPEPKRKKRVRRSFM